MQDDQKPTYVVFDTETTGLFDFKKPADAEGQPRLASAAFILADDKGQEIRCINRLIKPEGWTMTGEALAVNGLTNERLESEGVPVSEVLDIYEGFIEESLIFAAFNAQFDMKVMRAEMRRANRNDHFERTRNSCLMRSCKPYKDAGLPVRNGQFVKLEAACAHFGIENTNAHDAMSDARAALGILQRLIADGNLLEPKVHYAKKRPSAA
jgi:DNA polymerase III epsilon subunit-like protein